MFKQYKGLRRELYILFIGRVMTNLGSMIWPMLTLILNKKLGMNASEVANCMLVFSILALPVALLGGKLTDRLNKKNIIVVCDVVSVCCYIICGIIPLSFYSIIIMVIAALFQTVEWPAYDALVADFTLPSDRQRAYSLSYLGSNVGLMLSPTIGGLLFNNYLNVAFIINGLAILSSTLLIFFLIKDTSKETSEEDVNIYENELSNDTNSIKYIFSNRVLRTYLFASLIYHVVYCPYSFLIPIEMGSRYGEYGSILYGTMSSVNCITVVVLTSILTKILSKIFDTHTLILGMIQILFGLIIFKMFIIYPVAVYIAIIIFTIGEIIDTLGASPFVSKRIPSNYRGRITSVFTVIYNVTTSIFIKVLGVVYDKSGSDSAWDVVYIIGVIGVIAFIYLSIIDKKVFPELYK